MWDFSAYYWAAKASIAGLDPYSVHDVSGIAGQEIFPYLYPPLVTRLFYPLALLPPVFARLVYIGLQYLSLCLSFLIWKDIIRYSGVKVDASRDFFAFRLLVLCFAFNAALILNLRAGQVSIFENLFLWASVIAIIRSKYALFSVTVVLAALVKFTPVGLALFALIDKRQSVRNRVLNVVSTLSLFFLVQAFQLLFFGSEWDSFRAALSYLSPEFASSLPAEAWRLAPSALQVLLSIEPLNGGLMTALSLNSAHLIYALVLCLGLCAMVLICVFKPLRHGTQFQNVIVLLLTISIVVCIAPRIRDYSYIIMIFPFMFSAIYTRLGCIVLLMLSMIIPYLGWLPGLGSFGLSLREFSSYYLSLFTVIALACSLIFETPRLTAESKNAD